MLIVVYKKFKKINRSELKDNFISTFLQYLVAICPIGINRIYRMILHDQLFTNIHWKKHLMCECAIKPGWDNMFFH